MSEFLDIFWLLEKSAINNFSLLEGFQLDISVASTFFVCKANDYRSLEWDEFLSGRRRLTG